mmetsp:Transcript_10064/g.11755  ORF Transcript_10064/g.11755 Transcript_10064/m.11755 type:complete len:497 (-) Transcript_10064:175-1665(-)|eukprot:CAMPEP_0197855638 /NCGR_PEP_ID=MMETSP1438-20131217/27002_1 /TAXON_ID=1461541 /ORGANISM="Pterosperma sp., Strain CCMP1384" /LENGTH=496 /DNA_ID=CAMNT_0043470827 /DNA_START=168 /DNA_END=1658 /DNA_ORIENTATION=+
MRPPPPSMENFKTLKGELEAHDQDHTLACWESLDEASRSELLENLQSINFDYTKRVYENSTNQAPSATPVPFNDVCRIADTTRVQRAEWHNKGLELIAANKVGIILMSGGQGTRLGSDLPKGCYDILLPSHKSLFQIQGERIQTLKKLAASHAGVDPANISIPWYIMTSEFTLEETEAHFQQHKYFGMPSEDVYFFNQGTMPCTDLNGKLIMETTSRVARAPDGNGGLYNALATSGCLNDMEARDLEALDCYCVDNAIVRPGDPLFMGYCHSQGAECGARTTPKAYPAERVGVFSKTAEGRVKVVEYSELDPALAAGSDDKGNLLFNWSNICMHYFTPTFLRLVVHEILHGNAMPFHVAKKSIPSVTGPVPGIKYELFIFDSFPLTRKPALMEVVREQEFAPVKNAPGAAPQDTPETARALMFNLHKTWIEAAGGTIQGNIEGENGVEVSSMASYAGEGLEDLVEGKTFTPPCVINAPEVPTPPEESVLDSWCTIA